MKITQSTSKYSILCSNDVLLPKESNNLILDIEMSDSFRFTLQFVFESDNDNKQKIIPSVEGQTVTLTCFNFNSQSGIGILSPIDLATHNGKKVYVSFWTLILGDTGARRFSYSIYTER